MCDQRTEIETDEDETEEAETVTCDGCEAEISVDLYDENDGLCPVCLAETFVCEGCEGRTHQDDARATVKTCCEACGDSRLETEKAEALEATGEELQELVDTLVGNDDLDVLKRAVQALKGLTAQ
jgi:hypothetical protein